MRKIRKMLLYLAPKAAPKLEASLVGNFAASSRERFERYNFFRKKSDKVSQCDFPSANEFWPLFEISINRVSR